MAKPLSLSLLYTANLRGNSALLPGLFTLMQRLKGSEQHTLMLDLGKACVDTVWHCQQTQGRSMLILLDGMGYHAANITGTLDTRNRQALEKQLTMELVDETQDWHCDIAKLSHCGISATLRPTDQSAGLQICLLPAVRTNIIGNMLHLQDLRAGQIGKLSIELGKAASIISSSTHELAPNTPANPSISAAVEFVESEARLFQRKQSGERSS